MPITNPFSITWGAVTVGGSSADYLLHNPYVIDKAHGSLRLAFDVVVLGSSHSDLKTKCDTLEAEFRKRDLSLVINLNGATWTYTAGTHILNSTSTIAKSGDPASDKGVARRYNCTVSGELPADDTNGLRDLSMQVRYEPGRQKIVTMSGTYTALAGVGASAVYLANFDATANALLSAVDGGASWELVAEDYTRDRTNSTAQFTRQYVELLSAQSTGSTNSTRVRAHRVVFTNLSSHPADSQEGVYRLRRVQATYDAHADIDVNDDLHSLADTICEPYLLREFRQEFNPQVYAIEDRRVQYDESSKRIGMMITFVYQPTGGAEVIEVSMTEGISEQRQIDYTFVHEGGELDAYADPGWIVLQRTKQRVVIVLGEETPRRRLTGNEEGGPAGSMGIESPQRVAQSGWNRISNSSQVTPQWIGEPGGNTQQIRVTILNESVVERFTQKPGEEGGGDGPVVTPSG